MNRNDTMAGPRPRTYAEAPVGLGPLMIASFARGEVFTSHQPVISLRTGAIVEYEARRPRGDASGTPTRSVATPGAVDAGVLASAFEFILQMQSMDPATKARVSVDVSAHELSDASFAPRLLDNLAVARLAASSLEIELVDRFDSSQRSGAQRTAHTLSSHGVRLALGCFGRESTDLCTLGDINFDSIKLAPELIAPDLDAHGDNVLRSIVRFAAELGIDIVATGVELPEQHERVVRAGCGYGQGELYGGPEPHWLGSDDVDAARATTWRGLDEANRRMAAIKSIGEHGPIEDGSVEAVLGELNHACHSEFALFATNEPTPNRLAVHGTTTTAAEPTPELARFVRSICRPGEPMPFGFQSATEGPIADVIASAQVVNTSGDVLGALIVASRRGPDVEYRVREIIGKACNRIATVLEAESPGPMVERCVCSTVGAA